MKKQLLKSALIAVAGVGLLTGSAMADLIVGSISMTGTAVIVDSGTKIDFLNFVGSVDANKAMVGLTTGDFATYVTDGDLADMNDFVFSPFTANNPLWAVDGFSFSMTTLEILPSSPGYLALHGTGTVSGNGFEDTIGSWDFSNQVNESRFTWSAATTSVPEPTTMLLFGAGLLGVAGIVRRKEEK
ncbi:MAG: PEP-CTERM sorting domain-containing protein [Desulfobulbus sp.]